MAEIVGRINFGAKPHQRAVMTCQKRHRGLNLHRRAGKTVLCIFDGLETMLSCTRPEPRVAYIAPYLKQAKRLAWDYLSNTCKQAPDYFTINQSDLVATFKPTNAKFMLLGADNIDAIRGMYFDKIIVDEIADCDPRLWPQVIRPALADRKGRALLAGTPKGRMNMLYDLSKTDPDDPDWQYFKYDCYETGMLDPAEIEAMRREMSEPLFQQELLCSFNAALVGAVYGNEMAALQLEGRYTQVKYDASLPVYTAWDLGFSDATGVWFVQFVGTECRVIAYKEWTLTPLAKIVKEVLQWGQANDVLWANHYGPHDINVREYGSGKSRKQIASELGLDFDDAPSWTIDDGIEAVRMLLPHVWIDNKEGERGLECLVNYKFAFQELTRSFTTKPQHDWTSHGADAFRMLAVSHNQTIRPSTRRGRRDARQQRWLF